tara:strand:- start:1346 stop:1678 length:333 start_codon:yes stop_codon:yes gene_type:complete
MDINALSTESESESESEYDIEYEIECQAGGVTYIETAVLEKLKKDHKKEIDRGNEAYQLLMKDYKECTKFYKEGIANLKKKHMKIIMQQHERHLEEVDIASKLEDKLENK